MPGEYGVIEMTEPMIILIGRKPSDPFHQMARIGYPFSQSVERRSPQGTRRDPVKSQVHLTRGEESAECGLTRRKQAGAAQLGAVGRAHCLGALRVESVLQVEQIQKTAPHARHLPVYEANPDGILRAVGAHVLRREVVV